MRVGRKPTPLSLTHRQVVSPLYLLPENPHLDKNGGSINLLENHWKNTDN